MPRRKSVEAETAPAVAAPNAAEPKPTVRKTASRANASAAHKHHPKTKVEAVVETPVGQPVVNVSHDAIARLAYSYWEARGRQDGSSEQDWFRAESELLKLA
jgi:DUF2934 family protein